MAFTLDPEVAEALAPFGAETAGTTPPPVGDVATRRATLEGIFHYGDTAQQFPDDVTITDHELATADGATIRLRWYARKKAPGEPGPAALYLHGGGMISGHIDLFNGLASRYVSASGTPILAVDYRRAPEHPHPAPVEDTYAALVWLHEHADDLGVDPARIAVFGDSAGGGLAAAVSILARDRNGPAIAKQILVMPMLDDRTVTPDPQLAPFVLWSWDDNCTGWHALLGDAAGGPDTPVSAAPARVADPAGLPPAYIEVGQLDIFRDEDLTYALRLGQAGSRSSSTSTPASRTSSTSLPSTPPPPGASWPTASAPSPPCDRAANGTSSLPRPRRHPRCLRRSSCTSSRWPPAKPPRPTTLFAGSPTGSDPDWDSPACAKEEPDEPDRAVRRNDRLPRHGPGPHERAAARLLMDASL